MSNTSEKLITEVFALADVQINGKKPWDIQVKSPKAFEMIVQMGVLGLGESYVAGYWDCEQLDVLVQKLISSNIEQIIKTKLTQNPSQIWDLAKTKIFNFQTISRSFEVGQKHYDIGNDLFELMLDKRMVYTCGYWKNTKDLDKAQEQKLELVCQKLQLKKGEKILDIGCGWGSFMKYASEKYGVSCVGLTISKEQKALAEIKCKGLPVEFFLDDYRNHKPDYKYDKIVSLGMFEHVGPKNYNTYFDFAKKLLKPEGLFLLHTIGKNKTTDPNDRWIIKYIFPNSYLPSAKQIITNAEDKFILEDWHNFGVDYDKTLMAWSENFIKNYDKIKDKYSNTFYRMWIYYLKVCAGSFRSRNVQLWQIVFSHPNTQVGYESIR